MLKPQQLHDYQRECVLHQLYNDESMLWLQMGLGKEQPDSEPVLTPGGWTAIGNLIPGDYVIGSDGNPTLVQSVHPQGDKPVLKIVFNDGSFTHCGWDHLWPVRTATEKATDSPYRIMTTRELVDAGLRSGNNRKWSIPLIQPVQYVEKQLPIEPYLMGVLLGDGCVNEYDVTVCTDIEVIQHCGLEAYSQHETSSYTAYARVKGVKQIMRDLDLMGKRSWEKHVPRDYMRGSVEQRLALLQGLMDTDGSPITCGGGLEFSSTSENLADAVVELTQSLGGIARKSVPRTTRYQGGEGRPSWRVNVKLPADMTPFRLSRKLRGWIRPTKYQPARYIDRIEDTGQVLPSRCIRVAASDHLYVTRHHVVTHNTPITLTSIVDRMRMGSVQKVLIFGPLRVVQAVWSREAKKWEHTRHLRFSVMHGSKEKRLRALFANADVYLTNYENMNWLAETLDHYYLSQGKPLPFQMVVYDEISKLKNSTSLRMAGGSRDRKDRYGEVHKIKVTGWRKIIPHVPIRTGLTGTPASNGYLDLHGQYLAVDGGQRLGAFITHYKNDFFESDYMGWSYTPTEMGKQRIEELISDITKKMDAKDYLDMPAVKVTNLMVDMPEKARKWYQEVEKEMFTQLESGREIEVFSRSSVSNKCLQFCNGSPYFPDSTEFEAVHDAKLDALEDVLEEAGGSPVLCSYTFKSDAARIMKRFKKYKPVNLTAVASKDTEKVINNWNSGRIKLLIGHPASMGHGIDGLQESGSTVVWFGLNWSLELYEQMNGRIDRQGQTRPVSVIRILCRDTIDLAVADALERKTDDQEGLKSALQRYRDGITTNELEVNFF